jgi:hypothetical protein
MITEFILAPNGRWQGRDQTGQPIQNGKLYTYVTNTTTPKATYQDYQGLQPNTNPVILDGKGEANIYWATDELYTYKLFTEDDFEVTTQDNYPVVGTNSTDVINESQVNVARNEQFSFWNYGTIFSPVQGLGSQSISDFFCDDWLYTRTDNTYNVILSQQAFTTDQTDVPNNPLFFFRYQNTTLPATETNNCLRQQYDTVETFAGYPVTISFYAKSPTASTINAYLRQYFGTGGAPSAEVATLAIQQVLTTSWQRYNATITLPTLTGKTLGSNGDSGLFLTINFPNDALATVDICNVQVQQSSALSLFPYEVLDTQFKELNDRVTYALFSTGDVKATFKTVADAGWLMMADQTIGNVGSGANNTGMSIKALYTLLWNNVIDTWAPVSTGRGVSAQADFNALKTLTIPKILGRELASAGTGSGLTARVLGSTLGSEFITQAGMPLHDHAGSTVAVTAPLGSVAGATGSMGNPGGGSTETLVITPQGGGVLNTRGANDGNMPPTSFLNFMIKL